MARALAIVLPLLAVAGLTLPSAAAAALLLAVAVAGWLAPPHGGRSLRVFAVAATLAALLLATDAWQRRSVEPERLLALAGERFDALWAELDDAGEAAASALGDEALETGDRAEAFRRLGEIAAERQDRVTLLVLDPDGTAQAWGGAGLIHEIDGPGLPLRGATHRSGFSSVTLADVRPLGGGSRPWRLVAGMSVAAGHLPGAGPRIGVHWTALDAAAAPPPGTRLIAASPVVVVAEAATLAPGAAVDPARPPLDRLAAAVLGLALLTGVLLEVISRLWRGAAPGPDAATLFGLLGAIVSMAMAAGAGARLMLLVVSAVALACASWHLGRRRPAGRGWPVWAATAALVPVATGLALQAGGRPLDLAAGIAPSSHDVLLGIALLALVLAPLGLCRRVSVVVRSAPAWGALGAVLLAAATVDLALVAVPLLVVGALVTGLWMRATAPGRVLSRWAVLLLLAALVSSTGWEIAHRLSVRSWVGGTLLEQTAPPTAAEADEIARRVDAYFLRTDLRSVALGDPESLDLQDLGLALWRDSPLALRGALSALSVEDWNGNGSSFAFGLPLTEDGELDRSPSRGQRLGIQELANVLVAGESRVLLDGEPWGEVRYWLVPRPGYRLAAAGKIENLAEGLLRGEFEPLRPAAGTVEPARFALLDDRGDVLESPWPDLPLAEILTPPVPGVVATPDGNARVFATIGVGGARALFLPLLGPLAGLERVLTQALGLLLVATAVALWAIALYWRRALGALRQTLRSYSKRLLIVYACFVLVPILLLNLVLVRVLGEHLVREQAAAGRTALESAERILGEYVLTLDPGFGVGTALDDELLIWLSRVVRHQVNLYWGSSVYASSKPELFATGLLPKRIPGEVYSRLALHGSGLATRTNRAGGADYRELYKPVRVPGVPLREVRLVASIPLLPQQEELAQEIAALRRRALLTTVALMLLLAAIGSRLARSFTAPLTEIVDGTQRIAAGATSTGLRPSELELATLVEAIDRMAEKIAEGRERLMREKNLVERMIDNITSGVVSLDRERTVVMANEVARRLLGIEVGASLAGEEWAARRLRPVAGFLETVGAETLLRTVRLRDADGEEREWTLIWVPLVGRGEPSALLVVEDVTEVLRGQRLEAWAEMARTIAHEIKNPLTPIRLSTEHMREVRATGRGNFDEVFERCTDNILRQVGELQEISMEFLTYSRIPRADRVRDDLAAMAGSVVDAYRAAPPAGVEVRMASESEPVMASFDAKLMRRAVRNLVENAVRAVGSGGRVTVAVERNGDSARVRVADDGPGVDPAELGRIFDPYFSTHDTGTGLGLPIARRIAEEHGGSVSARNRAGGGLEVEVSIPVA